jgi:hypothetical protein
MTVKQLIDELNAVPEELLDSEITYRHCFEGENKTIPIGTLYETLPIETLYCIVDEDGSFEKDGEICFTIKQVFLG